VIILSRWSGGGTLQLIGRGFCGKPLVVGENNESEDSKGELRFSRLAGEPHGIRRVREGAP